MEGNVSDVNVVDQPERERFYDTNLEVLNKMVEEAQCGSGPGGERRSLMSEGMLPRASTLHEAARMRRALVLWLKDINQYRKAKPGVVALTVEIIDRYVYNLSCKVSSREVSSVNYQCIGAAAYLMSSKLEEVSPISVQELSKYTSDCCSFSDIMDMEIIIAFQLDFNVKFLTPTDFIYFLTNFINLTPSRKRNLIENSIEIYLAVINEFNLTKFLCHIVAMNSIILGYHELDDFSDQELKGIVKILIDLIKPEKTQLRGCYDFISNIIETRRANEYEDGDSSNETTQDF